jgi:hypothetical protein
MINASAERILTTLKACDGNEFNFSNIIKSGGVWCVGDKPICYVLVNGCK